MSQCSQTSRIDKWFFVICFFLCFLSIFLYEHFWSEFSWFINWYVDGFLRGRYHKLHSDKFSFKSSLDFASIFDRVLPYGDTDWLSKSYEKFGFEIHLVVTR